LSQIQADASLRDAIASNGEQLELCDESGQVIGYVLTPAEMRKVEINRRSLASIYAQADATFDADVYRNTLDDPRKYTTDEIIKKLGLQ
jgi:hypothetical protein